jgi:hypothetical protein
VSKNWRNDLRIDYKSPFNLLELIEKDLNFEELEKFESSLEHIKCLHNFIEI